MFGNGIYVCVYECHDMDTRGRGDMVDVDSP